MRTCLPCAAATCHVQEYLLSRTEAKFTGSFLTREAGHVELAGSFLTIDAEVPGSQGLAHTKIRNGSCFVVCPGVAGGSVGQSRLGLAPAPVEKCHGRTLSPSKFESHHFRAEQADDLQLISGGAPVEFTHRSSTCTHSRGFQDFHRTLSFHHGRRRPEDSHPGDFVGKR